MYWRLILALLALTAGLLSAAFAAGPQVVGPNLVVNGDFEKGLEGWTGGKIVTDPVFQGKQAAVIASTEATKPGVLVQPLVRLEPNKYYRVSVALRRTTGAGYVYVHCNWRNKAGERLMISKTWGMPRAVPATSRTGEHVGRWQVLSDVIINHHPDLGGLQLVIFVRDGIDTVYVDDVRIEEVRYPDAPAWTFPQAVTYPGKPSRMGMKVLSARQDGQKFSITTTGASYAFNGGALTCTQRVGTGRTVASLSLTGLTGPFKLTVKNDDVAVIQGPDAALGFQGDSLVTLATNKPLSIRVQSQIAPKHFRRADPHLLAIDDQGGFCVMPYTRPFLSSAGTTLEMPEQDLSKPGWSATYNVGARELFSLAVFPGRTFNWEQSFTQRIVNTSDCPTPEQLQDFSKHANVLFIFSKIYQDHPAGDCHAPYTIKNPEQLRATIKQAHDLKMQVIVYRHPTSYSWAGMSLDDMFRDMKRQRDEYGFDGWYLDGYPAWTDWMESYVAIRRLREEIGDKVLYVHCTLNPPSGMTEMYCPFIDSYCDFLLRGEAQFINGPADPYMRYVVNTQNISNALATLKGDGMRAAADSEQKADLRLQLETMLKLNGRCRWAYPKWPLGDPATDPYLGFYFPELDREYEQWKTNHQPLPMRWP